MHSKKQCIEFQEVRVLPMRTCVASPPSPSPHLSTCVVLSQTFVPRPSVPLTQSLTHPSPVTPELPHPFPTPSQHNVCLQDVRAPPIGPPQYRLRFSVKQVEFDVGTWRALPPVSGCACWRPGIVVP
ncbi:hypothetical protein E2C01_035794 [Portunus trituberculatus]|uniref:Uncharacterized protein n=1 Tax=Portunus trituberculatus TaxID=210409 RepID=A0A5B7FAA2_PORTR|nr:hypothetical protein [Portunus trituberculatus]